MFDKNRQYINLIRTEQNIKIDYRIEKNDNIIKKEQSIFALDNQNISTEAKIKLKTLDSSKIDTIISALCEDTNQQIVKKDYICDDTQTDIYYDISHNIVLNNAKILEYKNYYNDGNIDYLISPYCLLHDTISDKLDSKSLNILILNNKIYCIILDENKRLAKSEIYQLTPYDKIDSSSFFEDEIAKQKLYEEMYLLELQEHISKITDELYHQNSNQYFIENVNIYYNIRQLNDLQITILNDNLMIDLTYSQIDLDDLLYKIVSKPHSIKQNFITIRKKEKKGSVLIKIIFLALITTAISIGLFYYKQTTNDIINENNTTKILQIKPEIKIIKEISLLDHKLLNTQKIDFIINLFDTLDSNSVLKEIQIQKDESTLVYSYKDVESYRLYLKPKLEKLYKNSQDVLTSTKNKLHTSIISNSNMIIKLDDKKTKLYKPSVKNSYLDNSQAKKYIQDILKIKNVKQQKVSYKKYDKYIFNISKNIKSPEDFYKDIKNINNQYYSIVLRYPIEFTKTKNYLNISYTLEFNQNKKMIVKNK
jgi:polyhydroxyalkanoate synthesis regulator phasin